MAQITYANKVALNENPEIAAVNKVRDVDLNEIKQVVNDNYNNTVQITTTEPTDDDGKLWINPNDVVIRQDNVIESGSNANGNWIKYEDGTMICYKSVTSSVAMTTAWDSGWYEGNQPLGNFAQEFISVPNITLTNISTSGALVECFTTAPTTTNAGTITYCRVGSTTRNITTQVTAIGRWK